MGVITLQEATRRRMTGAEPCPLLLWIRQMRQQRVEVTKEKADVGEIWAGVQDRSEAGGKPSGTARGTKSGMTNDSEMMRTLMGAVRSKVTGGCELDVHEEEAVTKELAV